MKRSGGFTVVELVVVVTVVGVMMSIVVPSLSPGRWRADVGALEVQAVLAGAQRLAVLRQHDVIVRFREADRSLEIHRDADNDGIRDSGEDVRVAELPETVGFGLGGAPGILGDAGSSTVTFTTVGSSRRLVFHRNGSASESGRIYLRPLEGSQGTEAAAARVLTVQRSTGEVRCLSYRTGSWSDAC